jgi:hypothetical protein
VEGWQLEGEGCVGHEARALCSVCGAACRKELWQLTTERCGCVALKCLSGLRARLAAAAAALQRGSR